MKISKQGLDLIKKYEGLRLEPYLCPANYPTIGYGSIFYEDKTKVTMQDESISKERAEELLKNVVVVFEGYVNKLVKSDINQNQFDALVSFAFNLGGGNLKKSTLLKKVNADRCDKSIYNEFLRWNKARVKGHLKPLLGLTRRREEEAKLYFKD